MQCTEKHTTLKTLTCDQFVLLMKCYIFKQQEIIRQPKYEMSTDLEQASIHASQR